MRRCSKCHQTKSISEFSYKNKSKNQYSFYCKECNKAYNRIHYIDNRTKYRRRQKIWRAKFRKIIRAKMVSYLQSHPCVDCGETDYTVLEFDHIKDVKKDSVASLLTCDSSWQTLENEIDKCEVRCANCHKRRSAKQFGWYKYQ